MAQVYVDDGDQCINGGPELIIKELVMLMLIIIKYNDDYYNNVGNDFVDKLTLLAIHVKITDLLHYRWRWCW